MTGQAHAINNWPNASTTVVHCQQPITTDAGTESRTHTAMCAYIGGPNQQLNMRVRAKAYPHRFPAVPSLSCSAVPACPAGFPAFSVSAFSAFPAVSGGFLFCVSGGFRRFPALSGVFRRFQTARSVVRRFPAFSGGLFRRPFPAFFRRRFPAVFSGDLCATSVGRAVRGRRVMCGMAAVDVNYSIVYAPKVRGGRTTVLNIW